MFQFAEKQILKSLSMTRTAIVATFALFTLTGCYVEVSHEHEANFDTEVHYSDDITDFSTPFLVDAALIPFALSAESPAMLSNPDAFTTPGLRNLNRALIIETTYAYLFEDWDCDYGGFTQTEAEADTTSYDDGYTYVDFWMNAQAYDCEVRSRGKLHRVNSDVDYSVTGWYDDWDNEISSLDASLTGEVQIDFDGKRITHTNVNISTVNIASDDFSMNGSTSIYVDDGFDTVRTSLSTESNVHFYLGDSHPHAGEVRIGTSRQWVELEFEATGLWRTDSAGTVSYWSWTELGFN